MRNYSKELISLLFYSGDRIKKKNIQDVLSIDSDKLMEVKEISKTSLEETGLLIIDDGDSLSLAVDKEQMNIIDIFTKKEIGGEIGKAGSETLSIIAYYAPISRSDVNYIRGVNSNFILQKLLLRGLIEEVNTKKRGTYYKPTRDLLSHMGVNEVNQLPNYDEVRDSIKSLLEDRKSALDSQE